MSEGRVVLITGAFGGIGRELVLKFAPEVSGVVMWDMVEDRDFEMKLDETGVKYMSEKIDITRIEEVEAGVKNILSEFGRIDVLVNNAGITKDKLIFKMDEGDWDKVLAVNLKGAFLCSKIVGRAMFSRKAGSIVNMASIIGQIGNIGQANYSASKGGLIAFTKTCAREFGRFNVTVNAVAPGYVITKMTDALPEKVKSAMLENITLKRFGTPEDVANAVVFLASPQSGYITGQVLRIDGGLVM